MSGGASQPAELPGAPEGEGGIASRLRSKSRGADTESNFDDGDDNVQVQVSAEDFALLQYMKQLMATDQAEAAAQEDDVLSDEDPAGAAAAGPPARRPARPTPKTSSKSPRVTLDDQRPKQDPVLPGSNDNRSKRGRGQAGSSALNTVEKLLQAARASKTPRSEVLVVTDAEQADEQTIAAANASRQGTTFRVMRWAWPEITNIAIVLMELSLAPQKDIDFVSFMREPRRQAEGAKVLLNRISRLFEGNLREVTAAFQEAMLSGKEWPAKASTNARLVLAEFISLFAVLCNRGGSHPLFLLRQIILRRDEASTLSETRFKIHHTQGYQTVSTEILQTLRRGEDGWATIIADFHFPKMQAARDKGAEAHREATFKMNADLCGETFTTREEWDTYLRGTTAVVRSAFELPEASDNPTPAAPPVQRATARATSEAHVPVMWQGGGGGPLVRGGRYDTRSSLGSAHSRSGMPSRPPPDVERPAETLEEAFRQRPWLEHQLFGDAEKKLPAARRCHRCLRLYHRVCSFQAHPLFQGRSPAALLSMLAMGSTARDFPSLDRPDSFPK